MEADVDSCVASTARSTKRIDDSGRTELTLATREGDFGAVCDILDRLGDSTDILDSQDIVGCSALMYAIEFGHLRICRQLLNAGANPSLLDCCNNSAVTLAARRGLCDSLEILAEFVKDPKVWKAPGQAGLQPQQWATQMGHDRAAEIIGDLIDRLEVADSN